MPTFIEKSNCKGSRPGQIVSLKHNLRPTLTGKLLNDRHSPRYIIAPGGYGKSSLAYEYAQVVFEFKHVFWIRCESPCFMRDLDAGKLASQIFDCDRDAALIVCDDVPQLDPVRLKLFADFIEEVMGRGCEVICCCSPSNSSIARIQPDCMQITSKEMMLSEEETNIEHLKGASPQDFDSYGSQYKIPSLAWSDHSLEPVVCGMSQEELPISLKSAMVSMLLLGQGDLACLEKLLCGSNFDEDASYLSKEYPYLGIDLEDGTFQTMKLEVAEVAKGICPDLQAFSMGFSEEVKGDIASALADVLLELSLFSRAAEVMNVLGKGEERQTWLEKRGWSIVMSPEPFSFLVALETCIAKRGRPSSDSLTMAAWASFMLGDLECARSFCIKAVKAASPIWSDFEACRLLSSIANGGSDGADDGIQKMSGALDMARLTDAGPAASPPPSFIDWRLAKELFCKLEDDMNDFLDVLSERMSDCDGPEQSRALIIVFGLFLQSYLAGSKDFCKDRRIMDAIEDIAAFSSCRLHGHDEGEMLWPEYIVVKSLQEVLDRKPFDFSFSLTVSQISAMRKIDFSIYEQSGKWRERAEAAKRRKGEYELTHPDSFRKTSLGASELSGLRTSTPMLKINLFGGLSCQVGDRAEDVRILTRDKAKSLLGIISLNLGKEISRERLVRMLWPESNFEAANKNLYVVWSYLKKSLKVGDSCPYLLRTQNGFRLDSRYVTCDITDFEDLCRSLIFGRDDMLMWEEMYEKVSTRFSEDLLPCITNNQSIHAARKRYRDQLVDGLVAASNRLYAQDEVRGATWYAREAKRRDPLREDVYIALMEAQIASDQRASALDTYFECRRCLSENMGIDPSLKVMELYRSIIEEEHEF